MPKMPIKIKTALLVEQDEDKDQNYRVWTFSTKTPDEEIFKHVIAALNLDEDGFTRAHPKELIPMAFDDVGRAILIYDSEVIGS